MNYPFFLPRPKLITFHRKHHGQHLTTKSSGTGNWMQPTTILSTAAHRDKQNHCPVLLPCRFPRGKQSINIWIYSRRWSDKMKSVNGRVQQPRRKKGIIKRCRRRANRRKENPLKCLFDWSLMDNRTCKVSHFHHFLCWLLLKSTGSCWEEDKYPYRWKSGFFI